MIFVVAGDGFLFLEEALMVVIAGDVVVGVMVALVAHYVEG